MGTASHEGEPRRMLVIAYYFPPMGLSGVQRVSKFVKYLPSFGWLPTVLTVSPAGYFAFDSSLEAEMVDERIEIVRTNSLDPTRLFGRRNVVGMPREAVRSRLATLSQFLFLPDNKIGWYPRAVGRGSKLLREAHFDAILASAPPYTVHLIGSALKRRFSTPLVLDFRDDWVGNPRHVYPTPLHEKLQRRLESRAVRSADRVVTINRHIESRLQDRHPELARRRATAVISQGFDPDDFSGHPDEPREKRFRLLYAGVFYDAQRPDTMLHAVARFLAAEPAARSALELSFVGMLPRDATRLVQDLAIADVVRDEGYLPHDRVVRRMSQSSVLWMTIGRRPGSEGISTGKLFEYIGARKPILALVPEGEARTTLASHGASFVAEPDDVEGVAGHLSVLYGLWRQDRLPTPDPGFVARYDRRRLTGELVHLCNSLVTA